MSATMSPAVLATIAAAINARGMINTRSSGERRALRIRLRPLEEADAELLASIIPGSRVRAHAGTGAHEVVVERRHANAVLHGPNSVRGLLSPERTAEYNEARERIAEHNRTAVRRRR